MPPRRPSPTYPLPKYGPTAIQGGCEHGDCTFDARATCPTCQGDFCLRHIEQHPHAES